MATPTPFLDLEQLRAIAEDLHLKTGWKVTVETDHYLGPYIRFVGTEPDSFNPGKTVDLGIDAHIPPFRRVDDFVEFVSWRWREIWIHEARETFWYQNKLWSNPHA